MSGLDHSTSPETRKTLDDVAAVVGIGASAGGLEALERLFENMPVDTGLAFVVVQHLSPDFRSLTDELLARKTKIPIFFVENGIEICRDAIYLIPPRKDMILSGGRLLLTDKDPSQFVALPIDHFFRSLAQELNSRAIGIILSGTGSDGSRGIRAIHQAGGTVIVQSVESARFDGMPRSAIETGLVHHIVPPEEIPEVLLRRMNDTLAPSDPLSAEAPPDSLQAIIRLLRESYGIDFTNYKPETVIRRIERRLVLNQSIQLDEYPDRLRSDPDELNRLYKDLLIGVTRFFRDEDAFTKLGQEIIPRKLEKLRPNEEFRVWVAGCATGEEPYSFAILIKECLEMQGLRGNVKIFATDIHKASLEFAGAGVYSKASLVDVSSDRLTKYFTVRPEGYQVSSELRKMVVFAPHNVIKDAPFTKLDLISCRNLLIYLLPNVQKKVLSLFHFGLKTGSTLFLGPSEGPGDLGDEFDTLDSRWKIYSKRRDIRLAPDFRIPTSTSSLRPRPSGISLPGMVGNRETPLVGVYDSLLEMCMPPSILVDENRAIVQVFANASQYLTLQDGRFSGDLLDMVSQELRMILTGSIPRVFKDLNPIMYRGISLIRGNQDEIVNLTVRPIRNSRGSTTYALISFETVGQALPAKEEVSASEFNLAQVSREHMRNLESELRYTKENLQAMIEELETSNEELQATNEELVASNEELQSTNEELHSVNEELFTVNGEFQNKIAQLTELTSDMDNLLTSTEVHTIFLDRNLRIRKFTPTIAKTFNLLHQDIGRRIDNFTYSIDHPTLLGDIHRVLDTKMMIEQQVQDRRGNWFLMRILPYRAGLAVEGVVLTLVDITNLKAAESEARIKGEQLRGILRNSPNWIFIRDLSGRFILADDSFQREIGMNPIGKTPYEIFPQEIADGLMNRDDQVIRDGIEDHAEIVIPLADVPHTFLSIKFPIRDEAEKVVGVGGIITDVTGFKTAEQQAQEALEQRNRFLAMLSHELRNPLAAILNATRLLDRLGINESDATNWIGLVERRVRHMARLLEDLLDVSRITQNKIEIRKIVFDLSSTHSEVLEEVRPWYQDRKMQLIHEVSPLPLYVEGDPDRLMQIQVNLLMNAAKYTPTGGKVWYQLIREGDHAVIRVKDTGVGMDPVMLTHIFDLFFQANQTLDRSAGGIGVGLTLVKAIVNLHGGTVVAHSDGPGKGSEFVVTLPITSTTLRESMVRARVQPVQPVQNTSRNIRRIYLLEDDDDIRESLKGILEFDGYEVRASADPQASLQAIVSDPPDAAIVDIGLPGVNGFEVAKQLRADPRSASILLIALTGYGQPKDRLEAFAAGFDDHLTKPFWPEELMRVLIRQPKGQEKVSTEKGKK